VLSTDVMTPGTYGDGASNAGGMEIIRGLNAGLQPNPAAVPYTANAAGPTLDASIYGDILNFQAGGFGADIHGRGGQMFAPGDGEGLPPNNNGGIGFGGHGAWLITFDLGAIRTNHLGGSSLPLSLTGRYAQNGQGGPGETVNPGGISQGVVFVDGAPVFVSGLKTTSDPSDPINLVVSDTAQYLSFTITGGDGSTFYDDGTFRDMEIFPANAYETEVLADSPVAYYRLGEAAGPTAADSSGNSRDATADAGVTFGQDGLITPDSDTAVALSSTPRVVSPGFVKSGTGTSLECWVKFNAPPAGGTFANLVGDHEGANDFHLTLQAGGDAVVRATVQTDAGTVSVESSESMDDGRQYHVVATWDAATGALRLYVNSVEVGTATQAGNAVNTDNPVCIGGEGLDVIVDEVAIYDNPLGADRIAVHFDLVNVPPPPPKPPEPKEGVILSTDVMLDGGSPSNAFADGSKNTTGIEIVRGFNPSLQPDSSAVPYTSDGAGPTIDLSGFGAILSFQAGGFGADIHGRGGIMFAPGDGEDTVNANGGIGFGGHAPWIITFDLDAIRSWHMAGNTAPLTLTGRFAQNGQGSPGETVNPTGISQGVIFVDGVNVFESGFKTSGDPSDPIELAIDGGAQYLTFAIVGGDDSTFYDDGTFRDMTLTADPFATRLQLTIDHDAGADMVSISWPSQAGLVYNLRSETDPSVDLPLDWPIFDGNQDLAATPPVNTATFATPADPLRLFVVESFPAPPESVFSDEFENGLGDWTTGSDGAAGTVWELGTPSAVGPVPLGIPLPSPDNCFGTNIAADYASDANIWLRSPEIDLTNAAEATLCFFQWIDAEVGFDGGTVSVLDAANDSVLAVVDGPIDGENVDWAKATFAIPAEAIGKTIKLEFLFDSDDLNVGRDFAGWYIDDVTVTVP